MLHVLVISSLAHVFPQLSGSRTCGPWQQIRGPLQWGTGTLGNCWVWLRCYVSEWWGKHFKKNFLQGPFGKKPMFLLFVFFLQPNTFFCRLCWYFFSFSGGGWGVEPWQAPLKFLWTFHPSTPKSSHKELVGALEESVFDGILVRAIIPCFS